MEIARLGKKITGSYCLIDIDFQFFKMKRVLEMDCGTGCTIIWIYLITEMCTKMVKNVKFYVSVFHHNKKMSKKANHTEWEKMFANHMD